MNNTLISKCDYPKIKGVFVISKYFIKRYGTAKGFEIALKKGLIKRIA